MCACVDEVGEPTCGAAEQSRNWRSGPEATAGTQRDGSSAGNTTYTNWNWNRIIDNDKKKKIQGLT